MATCLMFISLPISNMGKVMSPSFRARERNNFLNFFLEGMGSKNILP